MLDADRGSNGIPIHTLLATLPGWQLAECPHPVTFCWQVRSAVNRLVLPIAAKQARLQSLRRLLLHGGQHVRVGVERQCHARVPEALANDFGVLALCQQ